MTYTISRDYKRNLYVVTEERPEGYVVLFESKSLADAKAYLAGLEAGDRIADQIENDDVTKAYRLRKLGRLS
jgi:hypothetical protein